MKIQILIVYGFPCFYLCKKLYRHLYMTIQLIITYKIKYSINLNLDHYFVLLFDTNRKNL